jgi:sacsin
VNLVRNIPKYIASQLKKLPEINSVTGQLLRKLFKSEKSRLRLQEGRSRNPRILDHLLDQLIPIGDDLRELDGCHIIPLADGTMGTLKLLSTPPFYYFASQNEQKLFDFASGLLVSPDFAKRFEKILSCEKFNVETLRPRHVCKLLERRTAPRDANPERDEWLAKFWDYWNKSLEDIASSSKIDIDDLPGIFRAIVNNTGLYLKPRYLHSSPAVVEPSIAEHQRLCGKFPGLWRFNNKFMPKPLRESESSFSKCASFCRFIRALKALASKDREKLGGFVKKRLAIEDLKVLYL